MTVQMFNFKTYYMIRILFSMLSVFIYINGFSQWQEVNTPRGLKINEFSKQNSNLYACTSGGIYKYLSSSWSKLGGDFNSSVTCVIESSTYLFAGTASEGVYRSSDNGSIWKQVNNNLTVTNVNDIQSYKTFILAGTTNGLFSSDNNGIEWLDKSANIGNKNISTIIEFNDSLIVGTQNGIFMSADTAKTWNSKSTGLTSKTITDIIVINDTLFTSTSDGGIFVSIDTAKNWSIANSGLNNISVNKLYYLNDTLFAGTSDSLYFTTNLSSIQWTNMPMSTPNEEVRTLSEQNKTLIIGNSFGVFKGTSKFEDFNTGFPKYNINYIAHNDSTVFISTDLGVWQKVLNSDWNYNNKFPDKEIIEYYDFNDSTVLVYNKIGLYISQDSLKSWNKIYSSGEISCMISLDTTIYIGTKTNGVYRTKDLGSSWLNINIGLQSKKVYYLGKINDTLFVSGKDYFLDKPWCDVYISTDKGDEWSVVYDGGQYNKVVCSENQILGGGFFDISYGFVEKFNKKNNTFERNLNGFISRESSVSGLKITKQVTGLEYLNDVLLLGTNTGQVLISTNEGESWRQFNSGFSKDVSITDFVRSGDHIYLCTNENSVYQRAYSQFQTNLPLTSELSVTYQSNNNESYNLTFSWQNNSSDVTGFIIATIAADNNTIIIDTISYMENSYTIENTSASDTSKSYFLISNYENDYSNKADFGDILEQTTSINDINSTIISVYPIPSDDYINIYGIENKITSIEIYNTSGNLVIRTPNVSSDIIVIDIRELNSGIYFAKIIDSKGVISSKKIIRE